MFTCSICNQKSDLHAYPHKGRMVCQKCYYAKKDEFTIQKCFKKFLDFLKNGIIIKREYVSYSSSVKKENLKSKVLG